MNSNTFISSIFGFLIGYLIGKIFLKMNNKLYHGPKAKNIIKNIYRFDDNKCYRFITKIVPCPIV